MGRVANLAAAGTVLLWASAFPAITVADRGLGPAGLAVARLAVASAALALAAPLLGVRRPRRGDLPLIALCGLAGMTGYQLLLNAGERVVPAGTASLLVATAPVYASRPGGGVPGRAPGPAAVGRQRGGAGRHRVDRGVARAGVRRLGADRAGRGGAPGGLPHRTEAAAGPVHELRGHRVRHVGRHGVHPAVDRDPGAGPAQGGRGGHRLGRLPGPGAVGGRLRAMGLRHGPGGRGTGHRQPLPGPCGSDRYLAGLARPGPRPGRAGGRGDRPGRRPAGPGLRCRGG